jgi:hypothetical protein
MHDGARAPNNHGGNALSQKQYRDKIVTIKKQQATDETSRGKARAAASKHRADAAKEMQKITQRTNVSMARTYQRNAENLEKRAQAEDKKVTDQSVKLGRSAGDSQRLRRTSRARSQARQRRRRTRRRPRPATGSRPTPGVSRRRIVMPARSLGWPARQCTT